MAQALGAKLLDGSGRPLPLGGAALANLARIDVRALDPRLRDCVIEVASDVTNPLTGPTGASAVYGPQKGATPADVTELDAALEHYADIVRRDLGRSVGEVAGAGAAGGLGAGLLAFTRARISSGTDIVIRLTGLVDHVAQADLVLTGEGRMDAQTRYGKTPFGVASVARAADTPVIGIAGSVGEGVEELAEYFDAIIPVVGRVAPLSEVLAEAASNVERTCANVGRLIALTIADH
jgi:glycerate kinase